MFSFNNPFGACPECDGLGAKKVVDVNLVIPDKDFNTSAKHAIAPWEGKMFEILSTTIRVCMYALWN